MSLQKVKIVAYQLGKAIHLKNFKEAYAGEIFSGTSTEVFIKKGATSCIYVQNYGEVAFSDCAEKEVREFIELILPFVDTPVSNYTDYKEDFWIEVCPGQELRFDYNFIHEAEKPD